MGSGLVLGYSDEGSGLSDLGSRVSGEGEATAIRGALEGEVEVFD